MTYEQTKEQFLLAWNSNAYLNMCTSDDMNNVIKAIDKQIPEQVVCEGDDESDYVYCPCCLNIIGSNENVWEDFFNRNWSSMHCQECGQSMVWK